jgi:GMP synthase (glutamine-hydrolysing)
MLTRPRARRRLRLLVLDAYPREDRAALVRVGVVPAGELYRSLLTRLRIGSLVEIAYPADGAPGGSRQRPLTAYDGVVWTGSSLSVHHRDDPRVTRQVSLAQAIGRVGVPAFGSCWAAQVCTVAAGGRCAPNPRGREFGIARSIALSTAGRSHPLFRGKPARFEAFTSHGDEIVGLPQGAVALAGNDFSAVQALATDALGAPFWAVQYHPEYSLREVARLALLRGGDLIAQGRFADRAAVRVYSRELELLHREPGNTALAHRLGVPTPLRDWRQRSLEVDNWLAELVDPRGT